MTSVELVRPTAEDVSRALRGVIDPELGSDIVDLGMVARSTSPTTAWSTVTLALTTAGCPLRAQIQRDVRARVGSLPGVTDVRLTWTEMTPEQKLGRHGPRPLERAREGAGHRGARRPPA